MREVFRGDTVSFAAGGAVADDGKTHWTLPAAARSSPAEPSSAAERFTGSLKWNVEPSLGVDSTQMVPPCASMIFFERASADPVSGDVLSVKALKNLEDTVVVFRIDSDAVIFHGKYPAVSLLASRYVNTRV